MDKKALIAELRHTQNSITHIMNTHFDGLISGLNDKEQKERGEAKERIVPLSINPSIFVGRKATAVIIDGVRITVKTWRGVYKEILMYCIKDPDLLNGLMYLRGKAAGKVRVFISDNNESMTRPLMITECLYVETHYGSQTMMDIMTNRILRPIGFDLSKVEIVMKSP
jgi:hypothetical protein